MAKQILTSNNETWGFWGTSVDNGLDAREAWEIAFNHYSEVYGLTAEQTRDFLDSRMGRHIADQLVGTGKGSIKEVLAELDAQKGWVRGFRNTIAQL